ncbi:MAG: T9SS type A sorting domain-containing protein [Sporocytophaga sp.]|uniref:T9SS type A sorting domain-containing protein n=1 Tax=Sporocytophaga sp. TaxID=2231183 RepID=UPI001B0CB086|nr:T9SS type A sorting domain-containing protein [Sporocytophaga sp.]MBO9702936.1 T9SS type A sorting domain-containing protein [Sporocytophaga sp.]
MHAQIQEVLRHKASGTIDSDFSSSIYFSALQSDTSAYITINNRFYWTEVGLFKKDKNAQWQQAPSLKVRNVSMGISSFLSKDTLYNLSSGPENLSDSILLYKFNNTSWVPASKKIPGKSEFIDGDMICAKDVFYIIYKIDNTNYLQKLVGMEWQTIASFVDGSYSKTSLFFDNDTFYAATVEYGTRKLTMRKINNGTVTNLNFSGEPVHEDCKVIMTMHNGKLILAYNRGRDIYDRSMQFWSFFNTQWEKSPTEDLISYTYDFMHKNGELYFIYPPYSDNKVTIVGSRYIEKTNEWTYAWNHLSFSASQPLINHEYELRTIRVLDDQIYFSVANDYQEDQIIVYGYVELGNTTSEYRDKCKGDSAILILKDIKTGDTITWFNGNVELAESTGIVGVNNDTLKLYNLDTSGVYRAVIKRKYTLCNIIDTTGSFNINVHKPQRTVPTVHDFYLTYKSPFNLYFPISGDIKKAMWYKNDSLIYTDSLYTSILYLNYYIKSGSEKDTGTYKIQLFDYCGNYSYTDTFKVMLDDVPNSTIAPNHDGMANFTIYPNPARGSVTIKGGQTSKITEINIYNSFGNLLESLNRHSFENISMDHYSSGLYIFEILLDNGLSIKKKVSLE